jgi:hypothetical protein
MQNDDLLRRALAGEWDPMRPCDLSVADFDPRERGNAKKFPTTASEPNGCLNRVADQVGAFGLWLWVIYGDAFKDATTPLEERLKEGLAPLHMINIEYLWIIIHEAICEWHHDVRMRHTSAKFPKSFMSSPALCAALLAEHLAAIDLRPEAQMYFLARRAANIDYTGKGAKEGEGAEGDGQAAGGKKNKRRGSKQGKDADALAQPVVDEPAPAPAPAAEGSKQERVGLGGICLYFLCGVHRVTNRAGSAVSCKWADGTCKNGRHVPPTQAQGIAIADQLHSGSPKVPVSAHISAQLVAKLRAV